MSASVVSPVSQVAEAVLAVCVKTPAPSEDLGYQDLNQVSQKVYFCLGKDIPLIS